MSISSIASSYLSSSAISGLSSTTSIDYSNLLSSSGISTDDYELIYNAISEEYDLELTDSSDEDFESTTDSTTVAQLLASMQTNLLSTFYDYSEDETGLASLLTDFNLTKSQGLNSLYQSLYTETQTDETSEIGALLDTLV
ncbi:MAG: hypothetical protein PWP16_29 [Eubacteriaceae bacterium]|jgi:hypothetical protein|nr:hypothetical protein [Eubacteriaceae bacterium]MDK2903956.1 hypothetical protein [Eubacteriaceae bacterium]MDK2937592.1 hypothetical protein [Eubacteriaceae bacterium]MDK2961515.1 hypothetical protein [Eubacteriaceae bacterium]MDN5306666.1 hypothetical protein [Eubacteriaceae bacterium]